MTNPHASKETIQRLIVAKVVEGILAGGANRLSVETGEQEKLLGSSYDVGHILAAIFASESEEVWLFTKRKAMFVKLVMGNGVDVISDYHIGLNLPLAKANALAIALEG